MVLVFKGLVTGGTMDAVEELQLRDTVEIAGEWMLGVIVEV